MRPLLVLSYSRINCSGRSLRTETEDAMRLCFACDFSFPQLPLQDYYGAAAASPGIFPFFDSSKIASSRSAHASRRKHKTRSRSLLSALAQKILGREPTGGELPKQHARAFENNLLLVLRLTLLCPSNNAEHLLFTQNLLFSPIL